MKPIAAFFLACVVAMSTMPVTGCNSQTVLNRVEALEPVINDVLVAACPFLPSPAPVLCSTGEGILTADEAKLFKLWQDYITAQAAGTATPGAWADLNAALQVFVNDAAQVFALAHIVNGTHQTEILAMVTAVEALLAVVESLLPHPPAVAVSMAAIRSARFASSLPAPNPKTGVYDAEWFKGWQKNWNNLPGVKARKMQIKGTGWLAGLGNTIGEAKFGG
jgi:hypothetical protein